MKIEEARRRAQQVISRFDYPPALDHPHDSGVWQKPGRSGVRLTRGKPQRLEIGLEGGLPTLPMLIQLAEAFGVDPQSVKLESTSRINIQTEYTFDESHFVVLTMTLPKE